MHVADLIGPALGFCKIIIIIIIIINNNGNKMSLFRFSSRNRPDGPLTWPANDCMCVFCSYLESWAACTDKCQWSSVLPISGSWPMSHLPISSYPGRDHHYNPIYSRLLSVSLSCIYTFNSDHICEVESVTAIRLILSNWKSSKTPELKNGWMKSPGVLLETKCWEELMESDWW